ncbi:MAG: hypothetical protein AAF360_03405 [Pseudomonadota bacterium]
MGSGLLAPAATLFLCGRRRVVVGRQAEDLRLRCKLLLMLARVALDDAKAAPREALFDLIWPGGDPDTAARTISQACYEINLVFIEMGAPRLVRQAGLIALDPAMSVDFAEALRDLEGDDSAAIAAAARLAGPFLSDVSPAPAEAEHWIRDVREGALMKAQAALHRIAERAPDAPGLSGALRLHADLSGVDGALESALCRSMMAEGQKDAARARAGRAIAALRREAEEDPPIELLQAVRSARVPGAAGRRSRAPRIVVKPFRNFGEAPGDEELGEALAFEIADALAMSDAATVVTPGANDVDLSVEGHVRPEEGGLTISARVVDRTTDQIIWSSRAVAVKATGKAAAKVVVVDEIAEQLRLFLTPRAGMAADDLRNAIAAKRAQARALSGASTKRPLI